MGERPRLSDEFVERLDEYAVEAYDYPETAVESGDGVDEGTVDVRTKLAWLLDEVEDEHIVE
jgi:hypothetical protein